MRDLFLYFFLLFFMQTDGENSKLIVNYLPQTLSDDEFRGLFLSCGVVKSSKICRDRQSGFSYGFGFIEYANHKDAQAAIDKLNGHQIGHKRIKVAFSRPQTGDMFDANLYMRGIPKSWTEEDLKQGCAKYGEIIQARILKDQDSGESRGTGFVLFNRKDEAEACRSEMNGVVLPGGAEPMVVKVAEGNEQKVRPPNGQVPFCDFNGSGTYNVGFSTTLAQPMPFQQPPNAPRYFQPYDYAGPVGGPLKGGGANVRHRYNPMSRAHHPQMNSPPYQQKSQYNCHHPVLNNFSSTGTNSYSRIDSPSVTQNQVPATPTPQSFDSPNDPSIPAITAQLTPVKKAAAPGYQLFVYNCGVACEEKDLYGLFAPYGAISKVDVVRDRSSGNTKFAFVTMLNYDEALRAVQALNGYCLTPRPLQVKFKNPPQITVE